MPRGDMFPSPSSAFLRWSALVLAISLPWMVALGSHLILEAWFPGQIPTPAWAWFSSVAFLSGTAVAVGLVARARRPLWVRVPAALLLGVVGLWFATVFHFRSNCGDYQPYVGRINAEVVASCSE